LQIWADGEELAGEMPAIFDDPIYRRVKAMIIARSEIYHGKIECGFARGRQAIPPIRAEVQICADFRDRRMLRAFIWW
jgi:hypothetical protein